MSPPLREMRHLQAFASSSHWLGALQDSADTAPAPNMCSCYFGLAQKRKTVIEITKNRDEGHLPASLPRVNMSLRKVKMWPI